MDFRIAPLLLVIFNFIFLAYANFQVFAANDDSIITWKALGISAFVLWMAYGALRGHHFLSKSYQLSFWTIWAIDALLLIALLYNFLK
jgi:hypothetical protein